MRSKLIVLMLGLATITVAQEIKVKGGFIQDSVRIGAPIQYWMSARYPVELDLFLPDSNFNFTPFEFNRRIYFETRNDSTQAIDSVVYSLQSFEIDLVQYLNLPAVVYKKADTIRIFTASDSLYFQEMAPIVTDTTALRVNTQFQELSSQFNSPLMMIILGILVVAAIVVFFVFGKKIKRHFQLKRMAKAHEQFISELSIQIDKLKVEGQPEYAELALSIWKKYQERIEKQPFSKLTSKEIIQYDFAKELETPLKMIDRCVYGKLPSGTVYQDFQHLEGFTQDRYKEVVDKIRHGA